MRRSQEGRGSDNVIANRSSLVLYEEKNTHTHTRQGGSPIARG